MENYYKKLENNNTVYHNTKKFSYGEYQNNDLTLNFVCSGIQNYQMNKKNFIVHPDCFLIINKGTEFESKIESSDYVQTISVSFDSNFINDIYVNLNSSTNSLLEHKTNNLDYHFLETLLPLKGNLLFNLQHIKSFINDNLNDDFLLEEYLHHTFINYIEIFDSEVISAENRLKCLKNQTKKELIKRLNLAKDYIYCNYNKQLCLKTIAENSCLSVNHLLRTFKQVFGETPHQFLTKLRLKRASYLIKNTTYSLKDIVSEVGFENPSSFIRLYKSYYENTPSRVRLNNYN